MANVETNFLIRKFFGLIPGTSKIETDEVVLNKDFEEYNAFENSKELADYLLLEKEVTSKEFTDKLNFIIHQKFSDTEAYRKEQEYLKIKGSAHISLYYKVKDSTDLVNFRKMDISQEMKDYLLLEKEVTSKEFTDKLNSIKAHTFEKTDEFKKLQEFYQLKKVNHIKRFFKTHKSPKLAEFNKTANSGIIQNLDDLERQITSKDFIARKLDLESIKSYRDSSEYKKEQEYLQVKNSSEIKKYQKFKASSDYDNYKKLEDSKEIQRYYELEKLVTSTEFIEFRKEMEDKNRYKKSTEYQKYALYEQMKNQSAIQTYFKFKVSKDFANFTRLDGSDEISRYEELEKYILSEEFISFKKNMLDKDRVKKTEEYLKNQHYLEQKNSANFKKYFELKKSDRFDFMNKWELSFEDDFKGKELDRSKWMTMYYWGKKLLGQSYALPGEYHFITDGKNLEVHDSILKIITRKEHIKAKAWMEKVGFYEKEFEYTSGLINNGEVFRQKYGIYKAKIRINNSSPVSQIFWMISEKQVPQIDIIRSDAGSKFSMSSFWRKDSKHSSSVFKGSKLCNNFYIFSLEWTADKLVWKINNIPVKIQNSNVPQEAMFINFSSGLFQPDGNGRLPVSMEIDWVKCYKLKTGE
ncbi:MAG: glycoside hydrolase family 16 protein [Bacteroidia bacterium]|nr:glycoside hydrolase family 16 protein [Bacteroidia bacterium]